MGAVDVLSQIHQWHHHFAHRQEFQIIFTTVVSVVTAREQPESHERERRGPNLDRRLANGNHCNVAYNAVESKSCVKRQRGQEPQGNTIGRKSKRRRLALQQQSRRGNRSNNNCAGNNPEIRGHERTTRRCHASGGDEATPFLVAATDIYNEGDAIHTANRKNSGIKSDAKAIATAAALAINHKDNRKRNMRRSTRRAGTLQELPQFGKVAIAARETINGGDNRGGRHLYRESRRRRVRQHQTQQRLHHNQ